MDSTLRGELWLVMSSQLFEALVEGGELAGHVLTVPKGIYEEVKDNWGMISGAFERAGYDVEVRICER